MSVPKGELVVRETVKGRLLDIVVDDGTEHGIRVTVFSKETSTGERLGALVSICKDFPGEDKSVAISIDPQLEVCRGEYEYDKPHWGPYFKLVKEETSQSL